MYGKSRPPSRTPRVFRATILSFLLLICMGSAAAQQAHVPLRVMTYNIRYDNPGDGVNRWSARREAVAGLVMFHAPDILCTQEGLRPQLEQLGRMIDGYAFCGRGRDDGREEGEHCAIFYRTDRLDRIADSTFWLSPTPWIPGVAWDAALARIATWARLRDKATGDTIVVFNTHFDHMGRQARSESARLLSREIPRIAAGAPVILAGDFNSTPLDEPYRILTSGSVVSDFNLTDTKSQPRVRHHGPLSTCCGFELPGPIEGTTIDFIFASYGWKTLKHATLSDLVNGRFPSDHLPVLAELVFE